MNSPDSMPIPLRPRASSAGALAAWAEAMIEADLSVHVNLGLTERDVAEVRRNLAASLVVEVAHLLGLRVAALADESVAA